MKAKHYVLTEAEHQVELCERYINVPNPDKDKGGVLTQTIPAVMKDIDRESIGDELRMDALRLAGIDKYLGGVGFGVLTKDWRGSKAGSVVIRHVNSSGYNVTVIDGLLLENPKPGDGGAGDDVAKLEQQRAAQKAADDKKRDPKGNAQPDPKPTPPVNAPAANDNKETPTLPTTSSDKPAA